MDTNIYTGTVSLFTLNPLNVDDKFFPVNLYDFSYLLSFVMSSYYLNNRQS